MNKSLRVLGLPKIVDEVLLAHSVLVDIEEIEWEFDFIS